MDKNGISTKERQALNRILNLVRRKLIRLRRNASTSKMFGGQELRLSFLQLKKYEMGQCELPLCELINLLRYYGCSDRQIGEWNVKISVIWYRARIREEVARN